MNDKPKKYSNPIPSLINEKTIVFSGKNDSIYQELKFLIENDTNNIQSYFEENDTKKILLQSHKPHKRIAWFQLNQTNRNTKKTRIISGELLCGYSSDISGITSEGLPSEVLICESKEMNGIFYIEIDNVEDQLVEARFFSIERGALSPDYPELRMKRVFIDIEDSGSPD